MSFSSQAQAGIGDSGSQRPELCQQAGGALPIQVLDHVLAQDYEQPMGKLPAPPATSGCRKANPGSVALIWVTLRGPI